MSSGAGLGRSQAGSGLGRHEVHKLPGKPSLSRLVFPVPLGVQPLLTLGTMLLCVKTFVMAGRGRERKLVRVAVCESLLSRGPASCGGS